MDIKGERMQGCAWVIVMHKASLGVEAFSGVHVSVVCWALQIEVRFYTLLHPRTVDCTAGKEKSEYAKLILKDRTSLSSAALPILNLSEGAKLSWRLPIVLYILNTTAVTTYCTSAMTTQSLWIEVDNTE